jgi:hypothetical protein
MPPILRKRRVVDRQPRRDVLPLLMPTVVDPDRRIGATTKGDDFAPTSRAKLPLVRPRRTRMRRIARRIRSLRGDTDRAPFGGPVFVCSGLLV